MNKQEELARRIYDAYCVAVGGKAFNGDQLPISVEFFSDSTMEKQANAWRVSAGVAIDFINGVELDSATTI